VDRFPGRGQLSDDRMAVETHKLATSICESRSAHSFENLRILRTTISPRILSMRVFTTFGRVGLDFANKPPQLVKLLRHYFLK
jgi:hypothetical protein